MRVAKTVLVAVVDENKVKMMIFSFYPPQTPETDENGHCHLCKPTVYQKHQCRHPERSFWGLACNPNDARKFSGKCLVLLRDATLPKHALRLHPPLSRVALVPQKPEQGPLTLNSLVNSMSLDIEVIPKLLIFWRVGSCSRSGHFEPYESTTNPLNNNNDSIESRWLLVVLL